MNGLPRPIVVERVAAPGALGPTRAGRVVVTLVALLATGAVVLRSPTLAAAASPLLLALVADLAAPRPRPLALRLELDRDRTAEGRTLAGRLVLVRRDDDTSWLASSVTVDARLPDVLARVGDGATSGPADVGRGLVAQLAGGVVRDDHALDLVARTWGLAAGWHAVVTWTAPLGLLGTVATAGLDGPVLRVLPRIDRSSPLLDPPAAGAWSGARPSPVAGAGVEFAGLRPFRPGDRPHDVHARSTARHDEPWVAARHPERNRELVLLVDAASRAAHLDAVRIASALGDAHLVARDRVGFVSFGQPLRWLAPGTGHRHRVRLLEAVMDAASMPLHHQPRLDRVPVAALPPGALVAVVAHLRPRVLDAVVDLRQRRRDVLVVDLDVPRPPPLADDPHVVAWRPPALVALLGDLLVPARTAGAAARRRRATDPLLADDLAWRLLELERHDRRARCRAVGAAVVRHAPGGGVARVVVAAGAALRGARVVRS